MNQLTTKKTRINCGTHQATLKQSHKSLLPPEKYRMVKTALTDYRAINHWIVCFIPVRTV